MVIRVEPEWMTSGSLLTQVAHRRCNLLAQLGEHAAQGGHGGWCPGAGSRAGEIGVAACEEVAGSEILNRPVSRQGGLAGAWYRGDRSRPRSGTPVANPE